MWVAANIHEQDQQGEFELQAMSNRASLPPSGALGKPNDTVALRNSKTKWR